MKIVRPPEMARLLQVTDALGIHREAVRIPLTPSGAGAIRIEGGRLVIEVPEDDTLEAFVSGLKERILGTAGVAALKRAT